ncbi:MAG: hypothetical protein ACLUKN_03975 [Bacilli bacterium]
MSKGEKEDSFPRIPKEFPNEKVAEKLPNTRLKYRKCARRILELDAEFFKAFEVADLDALKEKMRQTIKNEKKANNEILKRQFAVEQLMDKTDFHLESAVEDERHSILEEMMMRFMSSEHQRGHREK